MIGRRGERGSGISVLAARHDHDDDEILKKILLYYRSEMLSLICEHFKKFCKCFWREGKVGIKFRQNEENKGSHEWIPSQVTRLELF